MLLDRCSDVTAGAAHGLGCVVAPRSLIGTYLERGLLAEPLDFNADSPWGYYISDPDPSMTHAARTFRNWLLKPENAVS